MAARFDTRQCALGEGPLWHPERGALFWFDILGKRMLSGDGRAWALPEMASAAGWIDRETLLIATETGLHRFEIETGARERLAPLEADRPETRSNDGRADPMGGFWIGTMGKAAEPGAGAIYRYHKGALERLHGGISIPNAIAFAPDGRRAYFADTPTQRILTQPLDAEGWPDGPAEVFADLAAEGLFPDGAVTDAGGALWAAFWGAGRVARFTPEGRIERSFALPAAQTTCPAFGGPNLAVLYVTSARGGLAAPGEADGMTFALDPGARGRPEPRVIA